MIARVICLALVMWLVPVAHAVTLTASQVDMLGQLSPQEKAMLAKQANIPLPNSSVPLVTLPATVKPRVLSGNSTLERDITVLTADEKVEIQEVRTSKAVDSPVEKVAGQQGADKAELRRAFADFTQESKPLQVDTSKLQQFGYDLFAGVPTTFAPATDVPVPQEYVLGPGDELSVQLFGSQSATFTLVIDREGAVSFPDIGPLVLVGMSFAEAKAYLAQQVSSKMIGVSASVAMGKLRSIRIFALGEVARPGSYVVSGLATLSHALFVSGGIKKIGSLRNVQLKRQGKVVGTIDLYDFLLKGDTSKDVRLLPGDVVFVPPIGQTAAIAGQVIRPAIYELKGKSNINTMVNLAGGYLPKAYRDQALLERLHSSGYKSVKSFPLSGKALKTRVKNGDVIKVFSSLDFEENLLLLIGNVKRPGKYAWSEGMQLSNLLTDASVLLPETFMDYALIEREAEDNREVEVIRFNLADLFSNNKQDIKLKPRDKVYVFHRSHFRIAPKVSVLGSVKSPGEYELKRGMRLLDLVLASGGLVRDTYLEEAELYRTDAKTKDVVVTRFKLADVMRAQGDTNIKLQDLDRIVVHSIWEKKYRNYVKIQGEVKNPGQFEIGVGMRVSDLIFASGGVTRDVLMEDVQIYRTDERTKEIALHVVKLSAALEGDLQHNIELQDLDRVVVHSIWEKKRRHNVRISGEVMTPGDYVFAEKGMRLLDLLYTAGGVTEKAFLAQAEITRYQVVDGEARVSTHFEVALDQALAGDSYANIALQPYDVVMVRRLSNWRASEQVSVTGEVKYPGAYHIEDGERLSSLLTRAGGYLDKAYLEAAVFTRASIREQQAQQMKDMTQQIESEIAQLEISNAAIKDPQIFATKQKSLEAAKRVLVQMKSVKAMGRLVIKLSDIKLLKKSSFDMTLRDGDTIHIPKKPDQVLVMGQVYNSTAFVYEKGMSENDYIAMAGGMTRMADASRIYIIRASGRVDAARGWWLDSIAPGDTVVVPEELERFYLLDSILDWSKVLMNVGISAAAMKTIGVF